MPADVRITSLTLLLSIFLHVVLVMAVSRIPSRELQPELPRVTRYVMQLHQPATSSQPTTMPALPTLQAHPPPSLPSEPVLPRQPQPEHQATMQRQATTVPNMTVSPVQPRPIEVAELPKPKQPAVPQRPPRVSSQPTVVPVPRVVPKPVRPVQVQNVSRRTSKQIRRQIKVTKWTRPTTIPEAVGPAPKRVQSLELQAAIHPTPRQPSTQWQQTVRTQVPVGTPATSTTTPLQAYLAQVSAVIKRYKSYPRYARRRGLSGRVILQFTILADGHVVEPRVIENTGSTTFQTAALRTLRRASPMPPLPGEVSRDRLLVSIPILYQITD